MLDWGFTPPARLAAVQVKLVRVLARVMLFPAVPCVLAVTVTTFAEAFGVQPAWLTPCVQATTPTLPLLRLMALARLSASVVAPPTWKFVPVFEASAPFVVVP